MVEAVAAIVAAWWVRESIGKAEGGAIARRRASLHELCLQFAAERFGVDCIAGIPRACMQTPLTLAAESSRAMAIMQGKDTRGLPWASCAASPCVSTRGVGADVVRLG